MEGHREARALSEFGPGGPARPWAGVVPEVLTDRDRLVVREARAEILANPPPQGRGPVGCFGVIIGAVVLVAWPRLIDVVPGGGFVSPFVLLTSVVLVVGGFASTLFTGRTSRAALAAVEAALRQLEAGAAEGGALAGEERETALRAATLLISHAFISEGPTTVEGFDPVEAAARIGAAMPIVLGVQNALTAELGVWIPFVLAPEHG